MRFVTWQKFRLYALLGIAPEAKVFFWRAVFFVLFVSSASLTIYGSGLYGLFCVHRSHVQQMARHEAIQTLTPRITSLLELMTYLSHKLEVWETFSEAQVPYLLSSRPLPERYTLPPGSYLAWSAQHSASKTSCIFQKRENTLQVQQPVAACHEKHPGTLTLQIPLAALISPSLASVVAVGLKSKLTQQLSVNTLLLPLGDTNCALALSFPPGITYLKYAGESLFLFAVFIFGMSLLMLGWGQFLVRQAGQTLSKVLKQSREDLQKAEARISFASTDNLQLTALSNSYEQSFKAWQSLYRDLVERQRLWVQGFCNVVRSGLETGPPIPNPHIQTHQLLGAAQPSTFELRDVLDLVQTLFGHVLAKKEVTFQIKTHGKIIPITSDFFLLTIILSNFVGSRLQCLPQSGFFKLYVWQRADKILLRFVDNGYEPYSNASLLPNSEFFACSAVELEALCKIVGLTASVPVSKGNVQTLFLEISQELRLLSQSNVEPFSNVLPFSRIR